MWQGCTGRGSASFTAFMHVQCGVRLTYMYDIQYCRRDSVTRMPCMGCAAPRSVACGTVWHPSHFVTQSPCHTVCDCLGHEHPVRRTVPLAVAHTLWHPVTGTVWHWHGVTVWQ